MATTPPPAATRPVTAPKPGLHPVVLVLIGLVAGVLGTLAVTMGPPAWKAYNDPAAVFLRHNRSGNSKVVETASGLQYQVLKPGTGAAKPTDDDIVLVNYEGKLTNGTTFDASERPTPMSIKEVVPGFSEGLKLMPKGAKYRFWIPPALGYKDKAAGPIPPNSVLVFDLELLDWKSEAEIRQMQMMQQMMQQQGARGSTPGAPGADARPGK